MSDTTPITEQTILETTPATETPAPTEQIASESTSDQTTTSLITDIVKNATQKTSAEPASIDYSKIFPDGHTLTEEQIKAQTEFFGGLGVSEDQAKTIFANQQSAIESAVKSAIDSHVEQTKKDWSATQAKLKAETKEKFGSNFDQIASTIPQAINRFLNKEEADNLLQFFDETGIGTDSRILTFFSKLGKTVSEDTPLGGDPAPLKPDMFPGSGLI